MRFFFVIMIVGNGLISKAFKQYYHLLDDIVIFASGVSNSSGNNTDDFNREKDLLIKTIKENKKIIYFSSTLVNFNDKPYYKHKLEMEEIIKLSGVDYIIYRLPQIVGKSGNKDNIFNFIKNSIINNKPLTIYTDVERAILDVNDLVSFVLFSMELINKEVVNFSHIEKIYVSDLYNKISTNLKKDTIVLYKSDSKMINNWDSDNSKIVNDWLADINTTNYTDNVIKKYL